MRNQEFWKDRVKEGAVLSPVDRISEVLFGLIMVLTFTGAISVSTSDRNEVRELLWAALGCNVAWGLVDAIMYMMNVAVERGHLLKIIQKIHEAPGSEESRGILKAAIMPLLANLMTDAEVDHINERISKLPLPSTTHVFVFHDLVAGLQIFLLVFLCTLPVALPFAFVAELSQAMRISNGIALLQLFVGGYLLAQYAGFRRVLTALGYSLIGVTLVAITMALGG